MATMKYCHLCGRAIQNNTSFCTSCGHWLEIHATPENDSSVTDREQAVVTESSYMIPISHTIFMIMISYGLYFYYWLFLTWKHHRDHTSKEAFPYWHATTIAVVPGYGFFRVHAHMRVFTELMKKEDLTTTISPALAIIAAVASGGLSLLGSWGNQGDIISHGTSISSALINAFAVAITAGLLLHVQANLNSYWIHCSGVKQLDVKVGIGIGEVVIAVIGGILWLGTIAPLFNAAYRGG